MDEIERLKKVITDLLAACNSMLDEVFKKKATDWDLVNKAMAEAERYLNRIEIKK